MTALRVLVRRMASGDPLRHVAFPARGAETAPYLPDDAATTPRRPPSQTPVPPASSATRG